jgi:hypothetical protein
MQNIYSSFIHCQFLHDSYYIFIVSKTGSCFFLMAFMMIWDVTRVFMAFSKLNFIRGHRTGRTSISSGGGRGRNWEAMGRNWEAVWDVVTVRASRALAVPI